MVQPLVDGDCVELLADRLGAANDAHVVAAPKFVIRTRWTQGRASAEIDLSQ
jgi:hypothetical protein